MFLPYQNSVIKTKILPGTLNVHLFHTETALQMVTFRIGTTEKKGEDNFHDLLLHNLPARNMLSHEIAGIESAEKIVGFANLAFSR